MNDSDQSVDQTVRLSTVPVELTLLRQWVAWTYACVKPGENTKRAKIPLDPLIDRPAATNDPTTWASFEEAVGRYHQDNLAGIGFVFSADDPFVGIDLDRCRDPLSGELEVWAAGVVRRLDTYTEVSPSGTGVKLISRGHLPAQGRRKGQFELYDLARFFCITGCVLEGHASITARPSQLASLHREVFGERSSRRSLPPNHLEASSPRPLLVSDQEILGRALGSQNGVKLRKLLDGAASDHGGDPSAADLALCRILAFWCGPRPEHIDRLFRSSKRFRPKWDKPHFTDGRTYGEATIQKAIRDQQTHFTWSTRQLPLPRIV